MTTEFSKKKLARVAGYIYIGVVYPPGPSTPCSTQKE